MSNYNFDFKSPISFFILINTVKFAKLIFYYVIFISEFV
jgi:hypothetical protein